MKMSNKLLDKDKVAQCEGKQDIKQKEKNSSYMVFLLIQNFFRDFLFSWAKTNILPFSEAETSCRTPTNE